MIKVWLKSLLAGILCALILALGEPAASYAQTAEQISTLNKKIDQLIGLGEYAEITGMAEQILHAAEQILGKDHPDTLNSNNNLAELYDRQGRHAEAEKLYERSLNANRRARGKEHRSTLTSANRLALLYLNRGGYGDAELLFRQTLETRERVLGKDHPDTIASVNNLSGMYSNLGRYGEAEPLLKRALDAYERSVGKEHAHTLSVVNNLASLHTSQGRYADAEPLAKRALEAQERLFGPDNEDTVRSVNNLAAIYHHQGRYAEAEALYKRAIETRTRVLGKEHSETLGSVSNLAELYRGQGRYREAEPLMRETLATRERIFGRDHPDTINEVNTLAMVYDDQGRFSEAEALHQRALETRERVLGKEHPLTLVSVNNLATLYSSQGRYSEAEALQKRAIEAYERVLGKEHSSTLISLNNLASVYVSQGRYGKAEPLYQRVLAVRERVAGADHPDTLASVINLGALYDREHRYPEAEAFYRRALDNGERALGDDHPTTLVSLNNLAALYEKQDAFTKAEPLFKRAMASIEKAMGQDQPRTLQVTGNLALFYMRQGRHGEAESLFHRVVASQERVLGKEHPWRLIALSNLAELYRLQGRGGEAEALLKQVVAAQERVLGKEHPETLRSISGLAELYFMRSEWDRAAALWRRSTDGLSRRSLRNAQDASQSLTGETKSQTERDSGQFLALIKATKRLAGDNRETEVKSLRTMFQTAQWALASEAGRSLALMAARGAKQDPKLADTVRERQDLIAEWQKRDALRNAALGAPPERRDAKAEADNANQLAAIDTRVTAIDDRLRTTFPDYAALASPTPLSVEEVQSQLQDNEALVLFLPIVAVEPTPEETFIWIVTKAGAHWVRSALGTTALSQEVQALRCGLDYTAWEGPRCGELTGERYRLTDYQRGAPLPFDLARANALYKALFGGAEDLVRNKHLLIVPSGPLTQLPFQVLVTRPPTDNNYKSASWLARDHAITVLPAVSSLKALRRLNRTSRAPKPLIGFGNPLLEGPDSSYAAIARDAQAKQNCAALLPQSVAMRMDRRGNAASTDIRAALTDVSALRKLSPLPETADELCAVARDIGAEPGDLRLGARATEREVKNLSASGDLAQYRILHFATHGAMAGQLNDSAEPGLVLTPPAEASEEDDGYLSGSEIAELKLDADWVILSACNTAAGNVSSTAPLSGLGRAFIYAQARALLVSHWEVDSAATVKLITYAVREVARNRTVGRAEALRRAMLGLIDNGAPQEAHPAFWAPFIVVGEGAAR